ncbi:MAG: LysR family transcriptional regulator [Huintestinicola sp.]
MELSQLKYFYEAAECQHITNAAERLHIAQPALTQSIRRLEAELGVKLFERKGRSIALTECGTYLFKQLSGILASIDRLPAELARIAELEQQTIRVNILAASIITTEMIIEYKKLHPDIKFHLHQIADDESCDCTVSTVPSGTHHIRSKSWKYTSFTEEILLAVPGDSKYADMESIDLSETRNDGFISLSGSKPFHMICDSLCHSVGFAPNVIFESDSPSTVRDLIGAGMGIGFWPAYSWGPIKADNVLLLPISYPVCSREITVICHDPDSQAALSFYNYVCESLTKIDIIP